MTATPHSITQPLNLRGYLRSAPRPGWDFIAVLDILLIFGLLFLHHSRFVYGSGAEVDLVESDPGRLAVAAGAAVLTVRAHDMIFFDGQKIALEQLPEALGGFIQHHPGDTVLLLKVDRSISLQAVFDLFEAARRSGFDRIQIASEPPAEERSQWTRLP